MARRWAARDRRIGITNFRLALDIPLGNKQSSDISFLRECRVVTNGKIPKAALSDVLVTMRRRYYDRVVRWVDLKTLTEVLSNPQVTAPDSSSAAVASGFLTAARH